MCIAVVLLVGAGLSALLVPLPGRPSLMTRISNALDQGQQKLRLVHRDQTASALNIVLSRTDKALQFNAVHAAKLNQMSPGGPVDLVAWGSKSSGTPASEVLPAGTVAHRCGDYVFTYHGLDLEKAPPKLWLVVQCLDPRSNDTCWPLDVVFVGFVDGTVKGVAVDVFHSQLGTQNALRASVGLPPLPNPSIVTGASGVAASPP